MARIGVGVRVGQVIGNVLSHALQSKREGLGSQAPEQRSEKRPPVPEAHPHTDSALSNISIERLSVILPALIIDLLNVLGLSVAP